MRRLAAFTRITPEGAFTGADGDYEQVVTHDGELDAYVMGRAPPADTYLLGRRTYEIMSAFWPAVDERSALPPAAKAMAKTLNDSRKIVFSTTLKEATWKNTELRPTLDPHAIEALKRDAGGGILVLGSGSLVSQLTQHGLVDDYTFVVGPQLVGAGRPLFKDVTRDTPLELKEAKAFPSGNVLLRYTRRTT